MILTKTIVENDTKELDTKILNTINKIYAAHKVVSLDIKYSSDVWYQPDIEMALYQYSAMLIFEI